MAFNICVHDRNSQHTPSSDSPTQPNESARLFELLESKPRILRPPPRRSPPFIPAVLRQRTGLCPPISPSAETTNSCHPSPPSWRGSHPHAIALFARARAAERASSLLPPRRNWLLVVVVVLLLRSTALLVLGQRGAEIHQYLGFVCFAVPSKRRNIFAGIVGWDYYIKFEGQLIKHTCNRPMTPKWSECPSKGYRELSLHEKENKDANVYKRRKMDKDSNALVADEEVKEMATKSCTAADPTFSHLMAGKIDAVLQIEEPAGVSLEPNSGMNERSSVSSVPPSSGMLDNNAAAECSSSYMSPTEPITEITSARDLCIAILRKDGLLTESRTRITSEESTDYNANRLLACNTCGSLDDPLKMLICDSCEAAFHLCCCIPCIKEVPADEWYCPPCFRKKPKSLYGKLLEGKVKSSGDMDQRPHGMSHIEYMFKDAKSYVSGVRIDRDLQAEVPEWSGPTFSTDGYFEAPSEIYPSEVTELNWRSTNNHSRSSSSIGNWIQCREILSTRDSNKPVICGKWRRAPLYVVQSDKWDCSCCLPWDPAHADCAVPQELDTDEVLKQLKYVNMLKIRLDDRNQKPA